MKKLRCRGVQGLNPDPSAVTSLCPAWWLLHDWVSGDVACSVRGGLQHSCGPHGQPSLQGALPPSPPPCWDGWVAVPVCGAVYQSLNPDPVNKSQRTRASPRNCVSPTESILPYFSKIEGPVRRSGSSWPAPLQRTCRCLWLKMQPQLLPSMSPKDGPGIDLGFGEELSQSHSLSRFGAFYVACLWGLPLSLLVYQARWSWSLNLCSVPHAGMPTCKNWISHDFKCTFLIKFLKLTGFY